MALPGRGASFSKNISFVPRKGSSKGQRGIKVAFKILKSKKLDKLVKYYGKPYKIAVRRAMQEAMEDILKRAKADTPVDTGRLRDSGRIKKPAGTGRVVWKWEVMFGGIKVSPSERNDKRGSILVDYAQKIHEIGGRNGKPNFLLDNWNLVMSGINNRIEKQLRRDLPKVL